MESGLLGGFLGALSFTNLMYCFMGCVLGTFVGVLPGLGPAATSAILLPLTSYMPPSGAIIMLAGHLLWGHVRGIDDQYSGKCTRARPLRFPPVSMVFR